ncbi:MAG: hypothetical protein LBT50_09820 [Prevotellaceae bacterium]|jgi:chromosome segregation ATPase|nr:hypothetical protein [Prevotellaceae bacterium]
MRIFNYAIVNRDKLEAMKATDASFIGIINGKDRKIKTLEEQIDMKRRINKAFISEIESLNNDVSALNGSNKRLADDIEVLNNEIRGLRESNDQLSKKYVRNRNAKGQFTVK